MNIKLCFQGYNDKIAICIYIKCAVTNSFYAKKSSSIGVKYI